MSLESFPKFAKFLTEFNIEIQTSIPDKLRCTQCSQVLVHAHQAPCGCKYCRACVDKMVAKDIEFCSGKSIFCQQAALAHSVPDYKANTKISKLVVKCINPTCSHECPLIGLDEHLRVCSRGSTSNNGAVRDVEMSCSDSKMLVGLISELKIELGALRQSEENSKNEMELLKQELRKRGEKMESMEQRIEALENKVQITEEDMISIKEHHVASAVTTTQAVNAPQDIASGWQEEREAPTSEEIAYTIGDINAFRNRSYHGEYSDCCHGNASSYKCQLVVWNNNGEQLWVYLRLFASSTDDRAHWPFEADLTVTISNTDCPRAAKSVTQYCRLDRPLQNTCRSSPTMAFPYCELADTGLLGGSSVVVTCLVDFRHA